MTSELRMYEKPFRRDFSRLSFAVLIMYVLWICSSVLISWAVSKFLPSAASFPAYNWLANDIALYGIGLPVFILLCSGVPKYNIEKKKLGLVTWLVLFVIGEGAVFAGNQISARVMQFVSNILGRIPENNIDKVVMNSSVIWTLVFVVIIAPIVEEFVFRKCLCSRLARYGDVIAIVVSSLAFAAFHGNFYQFFYAFLLGLPLAYAYLRSGYIRYSVLLHMAINFIGSVIPFVINGLIDLSALANMDFETMLDYILKNLPPFILFFAYAFLSFASAAAALVLIICLRKRIVLNKGEIILPAQRVIPVVFCNAGTIAATVVFSVAMLLSLLS